MRYKAYAIAIALVLVTSVLFTNCSGVPGTSTGNPLVTVKLSSHVSPLGASAISPLFVSGVTFCFKRIRFKSDNDSSTVDPETDSENIDFDIGELSITGAEQSLGEVELPEGVYSRVEIDLKDDCGSGNSVSLTNSNGSFATDDRISIRFDGTFVVHPNDDEIKLSIQTIINQLNSVTNDSQIRSKMESVSGSF